MGTWHRIGLGLALLTSYVLAGEVQIVRSLSLILFISLTRLRHRMNKIDSNAMECTAKAHGAAP